MKFIRPINGGVNIPQKVAGEVKQKNAVAPTLGMFGFGFNKSVQQKNITSVAQSQTTIPQDLINKFANIETPKGKPAQLTIADEYYIPDREYADAEV